jgi:hypothetical protein
MILTNPSILILVGQTQIGPWSFAHTLALISDIEEPKARAGWDESTWHKLGCMGSKPCVLYKH